MPGDKLCSCLDFATNDLGTCKHIEFTLARLGARRGGKAALARVFAPPYSEVYLHQAGLRTVRFRPAADCPTRPPWPAWLRGWRACWRSSNADQWLISG